VGALTEDIVLDFIMENPVDRRDVHVKEIMGEPFPIVDTELPIRQVGRMVSRKVPAVMAKDRAGTMHIITQYDLVQVV
jgi:cystathionine beta-synthase